MLSRLTAASVLLACALFGQNAPHLGKQRPPTPEPAPAPQVSCGALRALTGFEFTVITAVQQPATAAVPEFCRVLGQVAPEIRFEVSLPASWNRRLYMFGNGGYAGENLEAPGRLANRDAALRLGFVVAQTNTGHDAAQEPLATFAVHSQKLYDFAFRSVHVTAETAKKLAASYYGASPARSYFNSCSTGGRQALILAQRFPQDFDGIVAGAPALDYTGIRIRSVATARALAAAPIPAAKLKLLAERVYERCDALDGLQDGLIRDPRLCDFKPSEHLPRCAASDGPACFTAGQIQALEAIYADVTVHGKRLARGWPAGAEISGSDGRSGWDGWILRDGAKSTSAVFAESFIGFIKEDPEYQLSQFDFERDPALLEPYSQILSATDTDLSAFRDRGGKLLMYHGWADPALNPLMAIDYYEGVTRQMGPATPNFFRLYMLPGVFHCGGGPGPAAFDPLTPLLGWVEQGAVPQSLPASRLEKGQSLRTRPLCPYPQVATYKGSGSIDDAANFACAAAN
jgi:hypothetical protein